MDLMKLVAELREYRAQVVEAITALEDLARRRHPSIQGSSTFVKKAPKRRRARAGSATKPMGKPGARAHKSS